MSEFQLIQFLHLIGFAYWLGGDLGVFMSSYVVTDSQQPPAVRVSAAKLLFALDQIPRICMTLMLPLGIHLAWRMGALPVSGTMIAVFWLIALAWLANVIILHKSPGGPTATLDLGFRASLSLILLGVGLGSLLFDAVAMPYWVAAKLAIFGGLIACGLLVRIQLRPFGPAFARIASGDGTAEDDAAIQRSLGKTRPIVITIWLGLLVSAALGIHLI